MSGLETAVAALPEKLAGGVFEGSVKFDIQDMGVIRIVDGVVTTEDGDADCTISASMETLQEMMAGELDPTAAFMGGKITVDGDMSAAMQLGQLLG